MNQGSGQARTDCERCWIYFRPTSSIWSYVDCVPFWLDLGVHFETILVKFSAIFNKLFGVWLFGAACGGVQAIWDEFSMMF